MPKARVNDGYQYSDPLKFEARNSKSETNPNIPMTKIIKPENFYSRGLDHYFIRYWKIVSDFGIRISNLPLAQRYPNICQIVLSIFLLLAWQNQLRAQMPQPVGTITFIEGVSDIARNNQEPAFVSEKEPVFVNDCIRTKGYSKVEITFNDKSVLKLAPDSYVAIEDYQLDANNKRERSRIKLTRGRIQTIVSKTGTPDTFIIDTPNAQGAVRGSNIFVSYLGGKTGVFVQEGAISVFNPSLPAVKTKVEKDNCILIPFNDAPGQARPTREAEISYFKTSVEPAFIKKWIPTKGAEIMNGVIVSITGTARIYKNGANNWREPKLNEAVSEGDKIQTEENANLGIRMSNANSIVLAPFTELTLTTLRCDASGNYQNSLAITKGRLSAVVSKAGKQLSTFEVQTPTSVCGVRGTFMEVLVNPAASGSQQQPATQVFFEGGTGFATSLLTGQTQEIGSGQNAMVDVLGKISTPAFTPSEQRNSMFQVWTSAQTMNSYSTADGATGVGSNTPQQPLPQPPLGGEVLGGNGPAPINDDIKKFFDIISKLTLDELLREPLVVTLNNMSVPFLNSSDPGLIIFDCFQLTILSDQTWRGNVSGTWSGSVPETWWAEFSSGGDHISFDVTSEEYTWSSNNVSGTIDSLDPDITFSGTMSGTSTEPTPGSGAFQGSGTGTWEPDI